MKEIVLIKEKSLKNAYISILSGNKEDVLPQKRNMITLDEKKHLQIKHMWCKSKKYPSDFFEAGSSYLIKVRLNMTLMWISTIAIFGGSLLYKFYEQNLLYFLPSELCVIYIFTYLTILCNRYFYIKKL